MRKKRVLQISYKKYIKKIALSLVSYSAPRRVKHLLIHKKKTWKYSKKKKEYFFLSFFFAFTMECTWKKRGASLVIVVNLSLLLYLLFCHCMGIKMFLKLNHIYLFFQSRRLDNFFRIKGKLLEIRYFEKINNYLITPLLQQIKLWYLLYELCICFVIQ